MTAAALQDVSKSYKGVPALDHVSLELRQGETLALLGPNGAGKSTAINILLGLKRPQSGQARLFDQKPQSHAARRRIGVTPQDAAFPGNLKVREILNFARAHYRDAIDADDLVEAFGLTPLLNKTAVKMSGGQQRMLAVALAFAGKPEAVFLDEPTTGLDIAFRRKVWSFIGDYKAGGGAVLLTTHYIEEAEALADRIILINHGRIAKQGSVEDIRREVGIRILRFRADQPPTLETAQLQDNQQGWLTYVTPDADATVRELVNVKAAFEDLEIVPASLEAAISILLEQK